MSVRPKCIPVHVTEDDHAFAKRRAAELGLTLSGWARGVLFGTIDRRIVVTKHPDGRIEYACPDTETMIEFTLHMYESDESRKARDAGPTPVQKDEFSALLR